MTQSNFALASWKEKQTASSDNRNHERTPVSGWEATLFTDDIISLNSEVEDSSSSGAGLLIKAANRNFSKDIQLTLTISTGQHKFTRQAIVRWVSQNENEVRFGVQYIDHTQLDPKIHHLDVEAIRIDPVCAFKIPASIAVRRKILPFIDLNGIIHVASCKLKNPTLISSIERMLKSPICIWDVDSDKLTEVLKRVYGDALNQVSSLPGTQAKEEDHDTETIDFANEILNAAYLRQASDIHIDPTLKGANIRLRVDGQLEDFDKIAVDNYIELASRIKVMAGLDIAEKRSPQDGRFSHFFSGGTQRIDLRVATLPTRYGERITLRLLAAQGSNLTLNNLGFTEEHKLLIEQFLKRIQGMMILTGPTGSGKTTTLYAAINLLLAERAVNIMTVEDPIEYEIAGAAQCEIDANSVKVSFNSALRSILRHDPDVVMIGEIRDKETAEIAIKAALTGHMVLSTLHTNSAAATVTRLIDMGVEPYLVAAALRLSVAQRLLKRLCKYCRIARPLTQLEAISINRPDLHGHSIYDPSGCIYCGNKGYSGRIGLYELLELKADWARAVAEGESEAELLNKMRKVGIKSLLEDATDKLIAGDTSYSEVLQVASSW